MVNFTLLIRIFDLTHSTTLVSLFVLSFGLPSLFFGAIAGVFVDRWRRRSVLVTTSLLRTGIVLLYLPAISHLPTIYATTFVMATVTQFFTPAEGALIPELVERKRLVAANAVFIITMFVSFVVGYGVAGPLAATGSDRLPIIVAAIMFALATAACATLPKTSQVIRKVPLRKAYRDILTHLKEGFGIVRRRAAIRYGLWQLTFMWSTIGVIMVTVPAFTSQELGLNLREVSRLIILPLGLGMLSGGYILHRARRQFSIRRIVMVGLATAGLAIIALGQVTAVTGWLSEPHGFFHGFDTGILKQLITGAASVLLGTGIAVVMIAAQTMIHEHTETRVRGRIFGVLGMSVNAANTIPVLAAGPLSDTFRVTTVVTLVGVGLVLWSLASTRLATPRELA